VIFVCWLFLRQPAPEGLSLAGWRSLIVFVACLVLWITHALPPAITSLLAMTLISLPGMKILEADRVYALFGNKAVFFILGALILAGAMLHCGLSSRLALAALRRFGGSPRQLLLGILVSGGFLSFWMPEHAVAAMLYPIVCEIAAALGLKPLKSRYGKALFIALAWGTIIGGVSTLLGGARNPLAVGILKQTTGQTIGFVEWMIAVVPASSIMLGIAYLLLALMFRSEIQDVSQAVESLKRRNQQRGRLSARERAIGLVMLLTILAWVFLGERLELANIAMIAVVALFTFGLVRWKEIEDYVNWGVILMYGGAICLGVTMKETGSAAWIARHAVHGWGGSAFAAIACLTVTALALTEGISNAAVVAMLLPVALSLSGEYGISPKIMTFVIAIPSGLGFMLPMGTPPNAIAYSSGYLEIKDMALSGLILDLICAVIFLLAILFYWPFLGWKI